MSDRRTDLINAGLEVLQEEGLAGLTQPKVAAKVNLRQGNLTYYFPTRTDLLSAVAGAAIERQLLAARELGKASSIQRAASLVSTNVTQHQNTRVLAALNQAADQEPVIRAQFKELHDGAIDAFNALLTKLELGNSQDRIDLVHALIVGLSMIDLASGRPNGKARAKAVMDTAFRLLAEDK